MQITTDSFDGRHVVFEKILDEVSGGASLNVARLRSTDAGLEYIEAGTPVYYVAATRVAEVCKSALVIDGGGATTPRVAKKHHFKVGDYIGDGTTTAIITAIDTTSATGYDTLTVNTALTYAANTKYAQGSAVSGSNAALLYTPNGLVKSPVYIKDGNADVSIVTIGEAREDALPYPLSSAFKIALRGGATGAGTSLITVR